MKPLFIIPLVLMCLVSFPSWSKSYHGLIERDGLYFEKFNDVPYSGKYVGPLELERGSSGKYVGPLELERGSFVDGRPHGLWTTFHPNAQLSQKGEYRHGKRSGHWVFRFETGKLFTEGSFEDAILNFGQCHAFRADDYTGRNDRAGDYHHRLACFGWKNCKQNTENKQKYR